MAEKESDETKKGPGFLRKAERKVCHDAVDRFWDCMKANKEDVERCAKLRRELESSCPPTWVTHFDRKFQYEKWKKKRRDSDAKVEAGQKPAK